MTQGAVTFSKVKKIMVVDDDAFCSQFIKMMLETQG